MHYCVSMGVASLLSAEAAAAVSPVAASSTLMPAPLGRRRGPYSMTYAECQSPEKVYKRRKAMPEAVRLLARYTSRGNLLLFFAKKKVW